MKTYGLHAHYSSDHKHTTLHKDVYNLLASLGIYSASYTAILLRSFKY